MTREFVFNHSFYPKDYVIIKSLNTLKKEAIRQNEHYLQFSNNTIVQEMFEYSDKLQILSPLTMYSFQMVKIGDWWWPFETLKPIIIRKYKLII